MLLEWWEVSNSDQFIQRALALLSEGSLDLVSWQDGQALPKIHWWVCNFVDSEHPLKDKLLEAITDRLVAVIENGASPDELINIIESVQEHMGDPAPETVQEAIDGAVHYELSETYDAISHLDSEHSLSEHLGYLDILAKLTGYDAESAKEIVSQRLSECEEPDYGEHRPSFSRSGSSTGEDFSDEAIQSLFWNLLR